MRTPTPDLLSPSRAMLASEMLKGGLDEISAIKELKPHFSIPRDMALKYAASQGWKIGTKCLFTEFRVICGIDPQLVLFKVTSLLGDSIPWVKFHESLVTSAKIGEFAREMTRRTQVTYSGSFTTNGMVVNVKSARLTKRIFLWDSI